MNYFFRSGQQGNWWRVFEACR